VNSSPKLITFNDSGLGCFLTLLGIGLFLGAIGWGWLVKSVLLLIILLLASPIIGFLLLRWWMKRNLIEAPCPVCAYEFTGFNGSECRCPSCGEVLMIHQGKFERVTPPGTIDVEAIEVNVKILEE
jgi:hypothetical protein